MAVNDGEKGKLKGVNLTVRQGEIHALMVPMVPARAILSYVMGHPHYTVTEGDILLDGESVLDMEPNERAQGFVSGVPVPCRRPCQHGNFLRTAVSNMRRLHLDKPADGDGRCGVIGSNSDADARFSPRAAGQDGRIPRRSRLPSAT